MEVYSHIRINLFDNSKQSFIEELDLACIIHKEVLCFSANPQASSFVEAVSALSEAMPWNALAKVIVKWIDARKNREVLITTKDNTVFHAKGYSVSNIEKILKSTTNLIVIDKEPIDKP